MAPKTQRALVQVAKGQRPHVISDHSVPAVTPESILVNVKAVTLNPTDWKHCDRALEPGSSIGCDFAGDIVEIGSNAQNKGFKIGDAVAGFIRGGAIQKDNGTFQEYAKTRPELVWHKPQATSYEDASSMGGIALSTAVQALYYRLGLPLPWSSTSIPRASEPILIWAGSTSVGLFAIHLAKLSNVPVITTASPHNHQLVKNLGADAVFDYKDPEVANKIKAWVKENGYQRIGSAFDTISEHGSTELVAASLGETGGKIVTLIPAQGSFPENVEIVYIIIYSALNPENEKDFADIQEWNAKVPSLINEKGLKNAVPLKLFDTGLESIPDGLDTLRAGKVSGSKLAYKI